jgi:hypothetical protein
MTTCWNVVQESSELTILEQVADIQSLTLQAEAAAAHEDYVKVLPSSIMPSLPR